LFCSEARASEIKVLKRELKNERKKRRERIIVAEGITVLQ
jgi:hypothetical protein